MSELVQKLPGFWRSPASHKCGDTMNRFHNGAVRQQQNAVMKSSSLDSPPGGPVSRGRLGRLQEI